MDSKIKGIVRCEVYNEKWKEEFCRIKSMLLDCIGDLVIGIEHVGSTSVEGLASKPIIDIDLVFKSYDVFPILVKKLGAIGFRHDGDYGIKDREAFKRDCEDDFMPYHLYACPKDSKELLRHISFRDYLRANPQDRLDYGNLKLELARLYPNDINSYMAGKHDLIQHIYQKIKDNDMLIERYPNK